MRKNRKERLKALGADALADALLDLAAQHEIVDDRVNNMISLPDQNLKRFKAKLSNLKRSRQFVHWGKTAEYARKLRSILAELEAGMSDPCSGAELVVAFYETDEAVLGNCDDSSGHVGDVYRFDAKDLFVDYARRCDDKAGLAERVFVLNCRDDYGVRDTLIHCAVDYLPEAEIRTMIDRLQTMVEKEDEIYARRHWFALIESLARQIKDAPLFEKTRIAYWDSLPPAACVDIATVYLDSDDPETALSWLERIPEGENFQADKRDRLQLEIFGRQGEGEKQAEVAWRIFRRYRSLDTLKALLEVIGDDQRDAVLVDETARILESRILSLSDAEFLVESGKIAEAAEYLIVRAEQIDGYFYTRLLSLARAMEFAGQALVATVIYRALLDSILDRGQSKTYPHGVRYLKKLDGLAKAIDDWRDIMEHGRYASHLRQLHGRKRSFWSRYEGQA